MHIIIDGVFNHCSWYFFAFDDVVKKGTTSKYCDWFYDLTFPVRRPESEDEIPGYTCFAYERKMPKLNTSNPEVQKYFAEVGRYWIREFDVDGWRLDVANEIDKNFWRNFRKSVKEEKKEAVLIGEVWENSETWLRGDVFDSTMNYDFRKNCRYFFAFECKNSHEFIGEIQKMLLRYPRNISLGQLNLLDSHDVPRFFSLCNCNRDRFKLALITLLLFPGVPSVLYGDELGMKGVSELEYRSPMAWERAEDELASFIKKLISIRKKYISPDAPLIIPETENVGLFSFQRMSADNKITVYMNTLGSKVEVNLCNDAEVLLEANCSGRVLQKYGFLIVLNKRKELIQADIPMFYKRK